MKQKVSNAHIAHIVFLYMFSESIAQKLIPTLNLVFVCFHAASFSPTAMPHVFLLLYILFPLSQIIFHLY